MKNMTRLPALLFAGLTIDDDKAMHLFEKGQVLKMSAFTDKGCQVIPGVYIENPKIINRQWPAGLQKHFLSMSIEQNFAHIAKSVGATAASVKLEQAGSKIHNMYAFNEQRPNITHLGIADYRGKARPILPVAMTILKRDMLQAFFQHQAMPSLPVSSFNYLPPEQAEQAYQNNLEQQHLGLDPLGALIVTPKIRSNDDMDNLIRQFTRHHMPISQPGQLLAAIKKMREKQSQNPNLPKYMQEFVGSRLSQVYEYVLNHQNRLDQHIVDEWAALHSADLAFEVRYHGQPYFSLLHSQERGLLKCNADDWMGSTNVHLYPDEHNAILNNLLPEALFANKHYTDKKRFYQDQPKLLSNFSVVTVPLQNVARTVERHNRLLASGKMLPLTDSFQHLAPSIDYHEAYLSESTLFEGRITGIPGYDSKLEAKVNELNKDREVTKLSGFQMKMPMHLRGQGDRLSLERNNNTNTFTHIAKMPMPGMTQAITLSEWLGLTLAKSAGNVVTRFQLARFGADEIDTQPRQGEDPLVRALDALDTDAEFSQENLRDLVETAMRKSAFQAPSLKNIAPPFIVIERFDITDKANVGKIRLMTREFNTMMKLDAESKYEASMEEVAKALKNEIPQTALPAMYEKLFRLAYTSFLVHNNDLHLKNMALLGQVDMDGRFTKVDLSPVYDVLVAPMAMEQSIDSTDNLTQCLTIDGTNYPDKENFINWAINHLDMDRTAAESLMGFAESAIDKTCRSLIEKPLPVFQAHPTWFDQLKVGCGIVRRNIAHVKKYGASFGSLNIELTDDMHPRHFGI